MAGWAGTQGSAVGNGCGSSPGDTAGRTPKRVGGAGTGATRPLGAPLRAGGTFVSRGRRRDVDRSAGRPANTAAASLATPPMGPGPVAPCPAPAHLLQREPQQVPGLRAQPLRPLGPGPWNTAAWSAGTARWPPGRLAQPRALWGAESHQPVCPRGAKMGVSPPAEQTQCPQDLYVLTGWAVRHRNGGTLPGPGSGVPPIRSSSQVPDPALPVPS